MLKRPFDDIAVGETASLTRVITAADVEKFVQLTGDDNPLHVDRAYARQTPFKDVVVHGMLGANLISTLIGTQLPGEGALWVSQSLEFLHPVRLGDELRLECKVLEKHPRERLLDLEMTGFNQNQHKFLAGRGRVKVMDVVEPPAASEPPAKRAAIVTGATGGIGQEIARALAQDGFGVVIHYFTQSEAAGQLVEQLVSEGFRAMAVQADLSNRSQIEALVEKAARAFGGVSVLVNNASPKVNPKSWEHLDWPDLAQHWDTQVQGAFWASKACVPAMQGAGTIINITSQLADGAPPPACTAYIVAKSALAAFSRCLAVELGPKGITVNCVAPGMTDTPFIGHIPEKSRLLLARQAPLRRLAQAEDVAGVVSFLASTKASYMTGETIRVNGGQSML